MLLFKSMEGFLLKKGRGESSFGRRTWKKRWVVLDGQYLTYYEDFNLQAGKAVNKKVCTDMFLQLLVNDR